MARGMPKPGQDLATLFPHIAEEWDYERNDNLKPEQVAAQSNKKVWWKCTNCGKSWYATIENRTNGCGCPYESGKYLVIGKNDLLKVNPHLAEEWDYERNGTLKPDQVTSCSGKKVWWKCRNCGMSWCSTVANRSQGKGCPYDSGRYPIPGKTDLASTNPQLAEEWDYEQNGDLTPEQITPHSGRRVWWKCKKCGMHWQASIDDRSKGNGCPYDSGRYPIPGKTDLASINPQLAEEWNYEQNGSLLPEQVTPYSNKKVWWKCKHCGMSWQAQIRSRTIGSNCPYDAGRFPIPRKTDLATINPQLAEEWDYEQNGSLTPEHVTTHSNKKVWWKCKKCGKTWQAIIRNRSQGSGCPYDSGKYHAQRKQI